MTLAILTGGGGGGVVVTELCVTNPDVSFPVDYKRSDNSSSICVIEGYTSDYENSRSVHSLTCDRNAY